MVEYNDVARSIRSAYRSKLQAANSQSTQQDQIAEARSHALFCARSLGVQEAMAHLIVNELTTALPR